MKKIVNGKLYDTETAESLGQWKHSMNTHSLYRTKKGAYFVVTTTDITDASTWLPVPEDEVFDWLVENGGDEQAANLFPDKIEEA
jgi:hypothetical protein